MAGALGTRFSGCILITLAMLAGMASARAETNRMAFSGAVVEATCSTGNAHVDTANLSGSMDELVPGRSTCGQTPTNPGRSYSRTVVSLDGATIASNRLLEYFASYANVEGGARAKLVVRTYE